ncbi:AAA family ATPase [Amycolatopsis sp., V23-08]|uniref:AAA family ATPase n=1 Tax=Amycolatopsis heterodermiae TaxID=3110235 RepID=A0ABU5RNK6_9PSEU|nr:AAA family ATPase [Amycolatopsis sp., V23-08]MEA5367089.1 AAA family ATPase [Amycolatopsis sp., V23-08]
MGELAGRDWELSLLVERARKAAAGDGQAVLLRGPAGIGKTRLLAAVLDELDHVAATVLTARCPESGSPAYQAVRELFAPLGPAAAASAPLARPALATERTEPAGDTYAVMHGLYWLAADRTADGPLVLAVDDVQWCDEASLRWLGFLLRRAENLPLLVILTQRTGHGTPNPAPLGELGCPAVDLGPLPADAVADVLRARFATPPEPAFAARCAEVTGGNPFLLDRVVTRLRADGVPPDDTHLATLEEHGHEVVARTLLTRLPPATLAVARAIAVLDGEDLELVAALAGTQPGPAAAAVRALRADELLRPDDLRYTHDLIRTAVLDPVPAAELAALRTRAATLLDVRGRAPEDVAVLLLLLPGPPETWMVTVLREAAAVAEERGAPAAAARYLDRALAADETQVAIRADLARVLAQVDPPAALAHLERTLGLVGGAREQVPLAVQYAMTSMSAQNSLKSFELVGAVLDALEREIGPDPAPADRARRALAQSALIMSGIDEKSTVGPVAERFRDLTPPPGETPEERQLLAMLATLRTLRGGPAAGLAAEARQVLSVGDVAPGGWSVLGAVLTLHLADETTTSLAALDGLLTHAQRSGEAWTCAVGASMRTLVRLGTGDVGDALADAEFAHRIVTQESWGENVAMTQAVLASALVRHGDPARALEIARSVTRPRIDRFTLEYHWLLMARAQALAGTGDAEGALADLFACRDSLAEAGIGNPLFAPWWSDATRLLHDLGRDGEAWAAVEEAEEQAAAWGTPRALGLARLARAVLTPGDAGLDLLAETADQLADTPARPVYAEAEYLLGRRLLERGDPKGARDRLRRAIDVAVRSQDRPRLDLAVTALADAGGRMRRGTDSPADTLSGSERRVAEKAAAGATNREIAESLFLTVRTVELHLTNVYRKLGLKGRAGLAGALHRPPSPR